MQKKNYGNSDISPCKNIIFKKSSKRNPNPSRYYKSITNLKFQHKPKYPKDPTWVTNPALISYLLGATNIVKLNNHTKHLTSMGGEE